MAVESWRKSPRSDSEQPCPEGGGGVLQWSVGAFLGLCRHPAARQSCLPVRVLLVADVQRAAGPGPTRVSGPQGASQQYSPGLLAFRILFEVKKCQEWKCFWKFTDLEGNNFLKDRKF